MMEEHVIFHIDVNSAFLSWEAVYRQKVLGEETDLRTIASAVGGDAKKRHGIILAKSELAKNNGVKTGDSIHNAKLLCPELVVVPPHYSLYEKNSKALMKLLQEYSPLVEQYSIDEAFCDMSNTQSLFGDPIEVANQIRERIKEELGFTVNIGISSNKLLAKMASDFQKPNRVHTLFPNEIQQKMWPLPVGDLFYVGRATKKKLNSLGIVTIGDLARTDVGILKSHFKKHGELIHNFANGIDVSLVIREAPSNKGYGNSTTIAFDVEDESMAKKILLSLCETVGTRLREDHVQASVVAIHVVDYEFHGTSHQMTLGEATNVTNELHRAACQLLDECWDKTPIRQLGVHTSKLSEDTGLHQMTLFDMEQYEKLTKLDQAVDLIRQRFGSDSIVRASFVNSNIHHMSGGIKKENR